MVNAAFEELRIRARAGGGKLPMLEILRAAIQHIERLQHALRHAKDQVTIKVSQSLRSQRHGRRVQCSGGTPAPPEMIRSVSALQIHRIEEVTRFVERVYIEDVIGANEAPESRQSGDVPLADPLAERSMSPWADRNVT
ncbi:hypothetical protein EVAR_14167_1 [Eumeta japonica]|uniref:BHLH domain-containing protein n=1 Tax=Eumeta variegata TaxID=151549 RepID=A0A4C1UFY9_EUMVA|nr:hypothetical protein EVAR_14167_1 [Eumeta japonica]